MYMERTLRAESLWLDHLYLTAENLEVRVFNVFFIFFKKKCMIYLYGGHLKFTVSRMQWMTATVTYTMGLLNILLLKE